MFFIFQCLLLSDVRLRWCFALTLQPGGIVLLCTDNVPAAKAPEEGGVSTHEIRCDASIQLTIYSVHKCDKPFKQSVQK